jgi:pyruvate dehydrogenase E2 component (dihydrolipoamide acetyltransferase)
MIDVLPHSVQGPDRDEPIVLLHGFAGDRRTWIGQQVALSTRHRTIAFDLPGHGAAIDRPEIGNAGRQAVAVATSLDRLGIERCHLVGHSMGGAVATILALREAAIGRVASLTLIAPGGFGTGVDADLLRRYAVATEAEEIAELMAGFFGTAGVPHRDVIARRTAAERRDPRVVATLARVAEAILDGDRQKRLDVAALAGLPHPIRLIWGLADRVIPVAQADAVPGVVAVHRFVGVGHMPQIEVATAVVRVIAECVASADRRPG